MQDKRDKLTSLLMDLMERQKQRAEDLQRMMGEMETEKEEQQDHYWLIQYQKLLDSKPKGLEKAEGAMDPKVKQMLVTCGAEELVPVFAKKRVTYKEATFLTEVDLKQMGVGSEFLRRRVLAAVAEVCRGEDAARHNLEGGAGAHKAAASAPEEEETSAPSAPENTEPSAPVETFHSAECVICMERKVGCHGGISNVHLHVSVRHHLPAVRPPVLLLLLRAGTRLLPPLPGHRHPEVTRLKYHQSSIFYFSGSRFKSQPDGGLGSSTLPRFPVLQAYNFRLWSLVTELCTHPQSRSLDSGFIPFVCFYSVILSPIYSSMLVIK